MIPNFYQNNPNTNMVQNNQIPVEVPFEEHDDGQEDIDVVDIAQEQY